LCDIPTSSLQDDGVESLARSQ